MCPQAQVTIGASGERRKVAAEERAHSRLLRRQHVPGGVRFDAPTRAVMAIFIVLGESAGKPYQRCGRCRRPRPEGRAPAVVWSPTSRLRRGPHQVGEMWQERRRPRARGHSSCLLLWSLPVVVCAPRTRPPLSMRRPPAGQPFYYSGRTCKAARLVASRRSTTGRFPPSRPWG